MQLRELPEPSELARAHSDRLTATIVSSIEANDGMISFEHFMSQCLYEPGLGYYSAGAEKLGEAGDFVTAPEISTLFGTCLANQIAEVLTHLEGGCVLEIGAGRGVLAQQLLTTLADMSVVPEKYYILETSADLKERQRQRFAVHKKSCIEQVCWIDQLPAPGFRGVVIANEVLDAFATQLVRLDGQQVTEICVANDYAGFKFTERPAAEGLVRHVRQRLGHLADQLPDGYITEINRLREPWVKQVLRCVDAGLTLLFDYGYPAREYYHPQRSEGTLSCFYRHHTHADPLILVGLQDITSHVDFSQIAAAADQTQTPLCGFTTQANFLIGCSLLEQLERLTPGSQTHIEAVSQTKRLMLPGEMGELVKVMGFARKLPSRLQGFQYRDLTSWL